MKISYVEEYNGSVLARVHIVPVNIGNELKSWRSFEEAVILNNELFQFETYCLPSKKYDSIEKIEHESVKSFYSSIGYNPLTKGLLK